ncbi:MAG: LCP family protein [Jatrophihabitantaceae bacterium]
MSEPGDTTPGEDPWDALFGAAPERLDVPLEPYAPEELTAPFAPVRDASGMTPEHEELLARLTSRVPRGAKAVPRAAKANVPRGARSSGTRSWSQRRTPPAAVHPHSLLWRLSVSALAFTVLLVASVAGLAGYYYQKFDGQLTRVAVLQPHDPNIRYATRQQNAENFLVIGSDTRAGADSRFGHTPGARSDTTMIVHLSPDHARATIISIPRDSWVDIPACKAPDGSTVAAHQDMFNSAFSVGGPACTIATVQKLTGIAVTHFLEIDFTGFEAMVSAMGTVSICSPQHVSDPKSGLHLHPGTNHLNGAQALAYVRARETLGDGSDLGRIKRQQMFLGAVLRQALSGTMLSDPARLTSFLDAATRAITIDRGTTFSDLRTLAASLQGLDPHRVVFYTAPIANADYTPPGTDMTGRVLLDTAKGRALYDSVIEDRKPVIVQTVRGTTTVVPRASTSASTPTRSTAGAALTPSYVAAQKTCTL